ncbi:thioredoxin family protein [Myxococcota bacterium]|nr:thioredoxin family protein [Myxococcota bacterium]MBU1412035.1 thioredoxin family protein [Myxococcota bacterium]MBU1512275.1 thioredoxin family protein [Myxococcota bacterium]
MTRTPSTMLELGTRAPDFTLPDPVTRRVVSRTEFEGRPLLVAFICNHCPYVILIREAFSLLAAEFQAQGVAVVAINANDPGQFPDDSPLKMIEEVRRWGYSFPYLFDESQQVARDYRAACTPDLFLFDARHELFYRGQFDDARPGNGLTPTGEDLSRALLLMQAGGPPPAEQRASLGCNIKWRPGNEPDYFG